MSDPIPGARPGPLPEPDPEKRRAFPEKNAPDRYEAAAAAAEPWKCLACGARMRRWQPPCPSCGVRGRIVHRPPGHVEIAIPERRIELNDGALEPGSATPRVVEYVSTGFATLDATLNGGFARGKLTLIGGSKGAGKTSAVLSCFERMTGPAGYASAEESQDQVIEIAQRIGAKRKGLFVVETKDLDQALEHFDRRGAKTGCLDSLNRFRVKGVVSDRGSPKMCSAIIERAQTWAREHGAVLILISHFTKDGDFAGREDVQHDVDLALKIRRMTSRARVVDISKSRIGPDRVPGARFFPSPVGAFVEAPLVRKPKPVQSDKHDDASADARRGPVDDPGEHSGRGPRRPPQRNRRRGDT